MDALLLEMLKYYGLKEVFGPEHNPEIVAMFHELGYDWINDDETAWCSASLNFFCKRLNYERSGSLAARSWLEVGEVVITPQLGDVVVYWRGSINGWQGHNGLYISEREPGYIYTLGGNQSNMINISLYAKSRVLGYRRLNKII